MIDHYDWSGGREAMLRFGPRTGPVVVVALPLFEEANRVRAFAVTICRLLAKRGVASVLPDLPGQGESLAALEQTTLIRMREAMEGVADYAAKHGRPYAIGIRSGALLDAFAHFAGRWHLAPVDGEALARDLLRLALAGGAVPPGSDLHALIAADRPTPVAGNLLSGDMVADLRCGLLYDRPDVPLRTIRLDTDPKPADRHVPGTPLWRRAEPDNDPALAALLADDIADWIAACEG